MEIRNQSKTGPVVPPLTEIAATLSRQIESMTPSLLDRLNRNPASFAQIEAEIHDRFRRLADQMTASLLSTATIAGDRSEAAKKGDTAVATEPDAPRRHGG